MYVAVKFSMLIVLIVSFFGCRKTKEDDIPPEWGVYNPTPYVLEVNKRFGEINIPSDNPLTKEGVSLGRMLYYDNILDPAHSISCSSCHFQEKSFSSAASVLPHINLGWSRNFLWNGKIRGQLEDIMLFEVDEFMQTNIDDINNHDTYPKLFYKAFGVGKVTSKEAAFALAQFFRILVSDNSKFDQYIDRKITFSMQELSGYEIFYTEKGDCFHCHGTALLTDNEFHNNGLNETFIGFDFGRFYVSSDSSEIGKFKTPTLRNVQLTAPYMHDGRYQTLEEVVEFYSTGLRNSTTIDPLMKNVKYGGINLTQEEKTDLVAFLKTFTDTTFISDTTLANPF